MGLPGRRRPSVGSDLIPERPSPDRRCLTRWPSSLSTCFPRFVDHTAERASSALSCRAAPCKSNQAFLQGHPPQGERRPLPHRASFRGGRLELRARIREVASARRHEKNCGQFPVSSPRLASAASRSKYPCPSSWLVQSRHACRLVRAQREAQQLETSLCS